MARKVRVEDVDYRLPTQRELQILTELNNSEATSINVEFIRDRQVPNSVYYHRAVLERNNDPISEIRSDVFYQLMLNGWIEPYLHLTVSKRFAISGLGISLLNSLTQIHRKSKNHRPSPPVLPSA